MSALFRDKVLGTMHALSRMDYPVATSRRKYGAISWNEAGITVTLHQLHTTVIASYKMCLFFRMVRFLG